MVVRLEVRPPRRARRAGAGKQGLSRLSFETADPKHFPKDEVHLGRCRDCSLGLTPSEHNLLKGRLTIQMSDCAKWSEECWMRVC